MNDIIARSLKVAKGLAGDDEEAGAAITAAALANGAHRVASRVTQGVRQASGAVRQALASDGVDQARETGTDRPTEGTEALRAKAEADPDKRNLGTVLAGVKASFLKGTGEPVAQGTPDGTEGLTSEDAQKNPLVLISRANDLVARAAPAAPQAAMLVARALSAPFGGGMTGSDVATAMKPLGKMKGLGPGTLKRLTLNRLLGTMRGVTDPNVFKALDAFSNDNKERRKALVSISHAILDMKIDAETAKGVLGGFNFTNSEPDVKARLDALAILTRHITRTDAPMVIFEFAEDDATRFKALKVFDATYNGVSCAEVSRFLEVFAPESRGSVLSLFKKKKKLIDLQNVGELDKLLPPKKTLRDTLEKHPELDRLRQAGSRVLGSFMAGVRGEE